MPKPGSYSEVEVYSAPALGADVQMRAGRLVATWVQLRVDIAGKDGAVQRTAGSRGVPRAPVSRCRPIDKPTAPVVVLHVWQPSAAEKAGKDLGRLKPMARA